jgi:hypothetical protein
LYWPKGVRIFLRERLRVKISSKIDEIWQFGCFMISVKFCFSSLVLDSVLIWRVFVVKWRILQVSFTWLISPYGLIACVLRLKETYSLLEQQKVKWNLIPTYEVWKVDRTKWRLWRTRERIFSSSTGFLAIGNECWKSDGTMTEAIQKLCSIFFRDPDPKHALEKPLRMKLRVPFVRFVIWRRDFRRYFYWNLL